MDPLTLYACVAAWVPTLYRFTSALHRIRPRRLAGLLTRIAHRVVPVRNYRTAPQFAEKDDDYLIEFAIHDTFDSLSPRFGAPLSARAFREIAGRRLAREFEVVEAPDVTLLRTIARAGD